MDTRAQIRQLARERIAELESEMSEMRRILGNDTGRVERAERPPRETVKRRTRNLSDEQRQLQGERMRKRWELVRAAKAAAGLPEESQTDVQPEIAQYAEPEPEASPEVVADSGVFQYGPELGNEAVEEPVEKKRKHR
jgi:hypothetical protein